EKITWVAYHFDSGHTRYYQVYDGAGNLTEKILNYNFNSVFFTPHQHGLWTIEKNNHFRSSQKIGDYPIITAEQARDLLLAGNYITPVPEEELIDGTIKAEHVINVELIYIIRDNVPFFLPYYHFVVKTDIADNIPEELEYGYFYVPAVEGEYLADFPLWDGTLNQ
ncbi:MAG TPA: hypothetical protein GX699_08250, partial [Firmicutes bacterium]|nr:hypothetical protein [Bacillota bacterium]